MRQFEPSYEEIQGKCARPEGVSRWEWEAIGGLFAEPIPELTEEELKNLEPLFKESVETFKKNIENRKALLKVFRQHAKQVRGG